MTQPERITKEGEPARSTPAAAIGRAFQVISSPQARRLAVLIAVFLAAYFVPLQSERVTSAVLESLHMLQEYAREHVLFCLIPAFFIAGAIANFVSQSAVIRYFGAGARKWVAYSVASVSGTILAVCSCTVLPLFAGIYRRGAGIGPAIAFLYSGPAINALAIILTARVLGWELGLARAAGAIVFSIVIGLIMARLYRDEDDKRTAKAARGMDDQEELRRTPVQNIVYFTTMVLILIFAAWGKPAEPVGFWNAVYAAKWYLAGALLLFLGYQIICWFDRKERASWVGSTWSFSNQILPLLFAGVLVAGLLMGRPGTDSGLIPSRYVSMLVGGNTLTANLMASVVGAFMYFATLTEVPILQGLIGSGMGQGPALALLLAGPALSLPNMLVIRSVLGTRKTVSFVVLVVTMSTLTGMLFGAFMA